MIPLAVDLVQEPVEYRTDPPPPEPRRRPPPPPIELAPEPTRANDPVIKQVGFFPWEGRQGRVSFVKLEVADPNDDLGPQVMAFNAATGEMEKGLPTPVVITVYSDRSFTFITKTPLAAVLLKKAAGIKSGSGEPNKKKVGTVTRAQLEEIAKTKEPDLTAADLDAAVRTIAGSARSMGLNVEGL